MANVRHVLTLDYVASILGEDPELIDAIVVNDDNLSYGSIITISAGPDDFETAITPDAVDELRDLLADLRSSPDVWDDFLHANFDDPKTIENIKRHKPR